MSYSNYIILAFIISTLSLSIVLYLKLKRIKKLQDYIRNLEVTNQELDEQTKLIIKTDLELKKIQEELDRKVKSLSVLHNIALLLSKTLDEEEILKKIYPSFLEDLEIDKFFIGIYEEKSLRIKASYNIPHTALSQLELLFENKHQEYSLLSEKEIICNALNAPADNIWKAFILKNIKASYFMLLPLKSARQALGISFFARESPFRSFDETDLEILRLLVTHLAQSLENARLFEEAYRSRQELDLKVGERTQQLEKALEELKNISRMKSDFVSSVSHELRTPLTSIKGYASLLASEKFGKLPLEAKERIQRIDKHADHLVDMVNNLLDIARIESGREEFMIKKENLKEIIHNTTELFLPQVKEKNLNLVLELPPQEIPVLCDALKIQRVLINLLSNAIKFTPKGGNVVIRAVPLEKEVKIEVQDSGIGIPPKDLKKIFDEFYRAENISAETKGSGLGLSLVKKIIEAHNSSIEVESQTNKGTKFTFYLNRA